jgi:DNA-binding XRE family transcriptional regulator
MKPKKSKKKGNPPYGIATDVSKLLGQRVKALRRTAGMTQAELAAATDASVPLESIGRIERGQRHPRLTTLVKIARGLGCSVGDLFEATDKPCMHQDAKALYNSLARLSLYDIRLITKIAEAVTSVASLESPRR